MTKKYKGHVHGEGFAEYRWQHGMPRHVEDYMKEFDEIEYNFVNDDYEDGHDAFKRIIGVDGNTTKITRRMEGTEEDFQAQFRPPFTTPNEGR